MTFLLLLSALALADVVDEPPTDCPPGSRGESAHSGSWCEADECEATSECPEGQVCRELSLCVDTYEQECGGMTTPGEPPCTFTVHEAVGTCEEGEACERGVCQTAMRCAEPEREGCLGCTTGPGALGWLGAAIGAGLLGVLRRRAQRDRASATSSLRAASSRVSS